MVMNVHLPNVVGGSLQTEYGYLQTECSWFQTELAIDICWAGWAMYHNCTFHPNMKPVKSHQSDQTLFPVHYTESDPH